MGSGQLKVCVLVTLVCLTILRNQPWQSEMSLWEATARSSPMKPRPHSQLGILYAAQGRTDAAITQLRTAYAVGDESEPYHYRSSALSNIAKIYIDQGNPLPALDLLVQSLTLNPDLEMASTNLAVIYLRTGHPQEALRVLDNAATAHPDSGGILFNQSEAMRAMGRCEEAGALLDRAQRFMPELPERPCLPR